MFLVATCYRGYKIISLFSRTMGTYFILIRPLLILFYLALFIFRTWFTCHFLRDDFPDILISLPAKYHHFILSFLFLTHIQLLTASSLSILPDRL